MTETIQIDDFAKTIVGELTKYQGLVDDVMQESVDLISKKYAAQLRKTSPRDTGVFARSWTHGLRLKEGHVYRRAVYSRKQYPLTHLLEYGHDIKRNGNVVGKARAFHFIAPARQEAAQEFQEKILQGIEKVSR